MRFTAREDVLLCDLAAADRGGMGALLDEHGVRPAPRWIPIARNSFACPALPTCSLALAESEHALPALLDELPETLVELDLGEVETPRAHDGLPERMCTSVLRRDGLRRAREDRYDVHLGGERVGVRLNGIFAENVPRSELVGVLRPVFARFAEERADGEEPATGAIGWGWRSSAPSWATSSGCASPGPPLRRDLAQTRQVGAGARLVPGLRGDQHVGAVPDSRRRWRRRRRSASAIDGVGHPR